MKIDLSDSISPSDDLTLPFGTVTVGLVSREHIVIANTHDTHSLVISELYLLPGEQAGHWAIDGATVLPLTLGAGDDVSVDVVFGPQSLGQLESAIVVASDDEDESELQISLSGAGAAEYLHITPESEVEFSGRSGGPFVPSSASYQLSTDSGSAIEWVVSLPDWLSGAPVGGATVGG